MKKAVNRRSFMQIEGSSLGIGVLYSALPRYTDGPLTWIIDPRDFPVGDARVERACGG